ncbi:MAG: ABC transporter permease subunit [Micromonosporaceae bacterium]|nr:ABC transporter permease subunit [Micromonosporaceae bacterium]
MTVRHLLGRLAGAVATLFGVAVVVFVVLRALPGDTITARLGAESAALDPAQRAALERFYGIDQPLPLQFVNWLGDVLAGDLGLSVDTGASVASLIGGALPVTVELAVLALLIAAPTGVALGVLAASRPGSARDLSAQGFGLFGLATPEFVTASITVAVLASVFAYFPDAGTFVPLSDSVGGNLRQLLYPALVLSIGLVASIMRTTRSAYLEVVQADFVRTAKGKGVTPGRIRTRHVLRGAAIPIVTMIGIQFGYLLGGTVIVEQVFALPGLGRLLLLGILQQDYALVQGATLVVATAFVAVNFAVDVLYRLLDPRTRLT